MYAFFKKKFFNEKKIETILLNIYLRRMSQFVLCDQLIVSNLKNQQL